LVRFKTCRRLAESVLPPRLISKLSIDMADLKGLDLRRRLDSADRFSDSAICRALFFLKTPLSKSSASLRCMTRADHLPAVFALLREVV
jgi:hypothetical protein